MKKFEVTSVRNIKSGTALRLDVNALLTEDNVSTLEKVFRADEQQNNDTEKELREDEIKVMDELKEIALRKWSDTAYKLQQLELAKQYKTIAKANEEMITTGNKWTQADTEAFISNHLYTFKSDLTSDLGSGYVANWALMTRTIDRDRDNIDLIRIDGQYGKKFATRAEAEKYIKGRFHKYQDYFREEYPEIPAEFAENMKFMGVLLPGYKVETQKSGN